MTTTPHQSLENPMQSEQPALFPVADIQTDGYAQPEPRDEAEDTERVEIEDAA